MGSSSQFLFHKLVIVVLVGLMMLASTCVSMTEDEEMTGLPERPSVFHSPEELREYLRALNEYFAVVGRPRFGRSVRQAWAPSGSGNHLFSLSNRSK